MKCEKCRVNESVVVLNRSRVCESCKNHIFLKNAERNFKMMDDLLELAKIQPGLARNREEYEEAYHRLPIIQRDFELAKKRYDYAYKNAYKFA